MRAILCLLFCLSAGCGTPSASGGDIGPDECVIPTGFDTVMQIAVDPDDPAQTNGLPDHRKVLALALKIAGRESPEQGADWSHGVVVDLDTGEPVWHYFRDKSNESIRRVECSDASQAHVMTRLTPPEDWRFAHLFGPCELGDTRPCGCPDGRESVRTCEVPFKYRETYPEDAFSACACD